MEGRQQSFQVEWAMLCYASFTTAAAPFDPALTAIDGANVVGPLEDLGA